MSSHVRGPRSTSSNSSQALNTPVRPNMLSSGSYQDDMISQAQEQQSIYGDPGLRAVNDYEGDDYHNAHPRKRINTDGFDNPKKRAAVAVSCIGATATLPFLPTQWLINDSAMFAAVANPSATARSRDVGYAPSLMPSVYIKSQASSLMREIG